MRLPTAFVLCLAFISPSLEEMAAPALLMLRPDVNTAGMSPCMAKNISINKTKIIDLHLYLCSSITVSCVFADVNVNLVGRDKLEMPGGKVLSKFNSVGHAHEYRVMDLNDLDFFF